MLSDKAQLTSLYDQDFQLWLDQTVAQLKAQDFSSLDLENLIEEIESLGRSDKRAISSCLMRLCEHLLKIKYWETERQTCLRDWMLEISTFRSEIELILQDSPSLNQFLDQKFPSVYQKTRSNFLKVALLPAGSISETPDFTLEQALDEDWLPWKPDWN